MERYELTDACALVVENDDITNSSVDAIVNAANEQMLGGGGVDGAIHRAAGPQLVEACRAIEPVRPHVRCPTGEARITPGFLLRAKFVIHAVGPIFSSTEKSGPLLVSAYRSSLELARKYELTSIGFPAISCGAYRFPLEEAALLSIATCRDHALDLEEIRFVLFGNETYNVWRRTALDLLAPNA